jgi:heat shock protein HslJ
MMKKMGKRIAGALALALLLLLLPGGALAQAPTLSGTDYVVQPGDWLARIATQQYGDAALYPAIVLATNAMAASDGSYATITDPWRIEPGWKLSIPSVEDAQSALTVSTLQNAEYRSEWTASGTAQLADGEYSETITPGAASKIVIKLHWHMAFGYTGDGTPSDGAPFAAVILLTNSGGSGTFYDLVAVVDREGKPVEVASTLLGDRVQIESLAVEKGEIVVQMVQQGPDDPMCCPTQRVVVRYALQGDQLVETSSKVVLPDIVGITWEWEHFVGGDDSVVEVNEPSRYTLTLKADGTYQVKADCNLSGGAYTLKGSSLVLELGPMTLAECEPGSLYDEFLAKLGDVRTYVLDEGKLVLNLWADAGNMVLRKGQAEDELAADENVGFDPQGIALDTQDLPCG